MANYVNFTVGKDLGVRLHEISKDHLLNLDIDKALSLWTQSIRCSEDIAERLTFGELILDIDDGGVAFAKPWEEIDPERLKDYPKLTVSDLRNIITDLVNNEDINEVIYVLNDLTELFDHERSGIVNQYRERLSDLQYVSINLEILDHDFLGMFEEVEGKVRLKDLLEYLFIDGNEIPYEVQLYVTGETVDKLFYLSTIYRKILDNANKVFRVIELSRKYFDSIDNLQLNFGSLLDALRNFLKSIKSYIDRENNIRGTSSESPKSIDRVSAFKNVSESIKYFHPVNILDNYTAGYLAPDGLFFGLNGVEHSLLHITLADCILKYRNIKIPKDYKYSADWYLNELGYVKIDTDHITLDTLDENGDNKVPNEKQLEIIAEYGDKCHNGHLRFGDSRDSISMYKFRQMDEFQLKKLFQYF